MINAVRTTRIYCRPSCSARPKPENVTTYPSRAAAERAGYRACRRCRPELGEELRFATARTPFGTALVAAGEVNRGPGPVFSVREVLFGDSAAHAEAELRAAHPGAFIRRDRSLRAVAAAILDSPRVQLDMRGTSFQREVWRKLLEIPRGETRTYSQLAAELGRPRSARAVARACATNRIGVLAPCHRVVGADGGLTGYRWGVDRKRALLRAEGAEVRASPAPRPRARPASRARR